MKNLIFDRKIAIMACFLNCATKKVSVYFQKTVVSKFPFDFWGHFLVKNFPVGSMMYNWFNLV